MNAARRVNFYLVLVFLGVFLLILTGCGAEATPKDQLPQGTEIVCLNGQDMLIVRDQDGTIAEAEALKTSDTCFQEAS